MPYNRLQASGLIHQFTFMSIKIVEKFIEEITVFRKTLHQYPELSGQEKDTAVRLLEFLKKLHPDKILENIGGYGVAAVYASGKPGPTVLLRADMDALPIQEVNTFAYRSERKGVAHKCGHDGHMAIMAGLARLLKEYRPQKGQVVLLFQPAEETGQGAAKVIADEGFSSLSPDYVFALHNLPGYPEQQMVIKEGPFAAASRGMIINMAGRSSHAAHPEQGNSPVHMMTELIRGLTNIPRRKTVFDDFALLTIIHARLGEVAFGTNPGKAVVMATLRTFLDEDMKRLTELAEKTVHLLAETYDVVSEISYTEVFPATINDPKATRLAKEAAIRSGLDIHISQDTFRWSEDFGHFTSAWPGTLFGIGAGKEHPSLHNHDYDFPDAILPAGIKMFYHIADQLVNLHKNV